LAKFLCIQDKATKLNVSQPSTFNITPDMHHGTVNVARNFKVPVNFTTPTLSLYTYAAASLATSNAKLVIEQNYGHLDVIIFGVS
jgi:hypothetical protein